MKLSTVTLTEGPNGICISAGLQQFENDDYAECVFPRLVSIISQYQLLNEFARNFEAMKTTLSVFPRETCLFRVKLRSLLKMSINRCNYIYNHGYNRMLLHCF